MKRHTVTEENYLKAIYKFSRENELVTTNMLSGYLKTTPASVTDMVKKLSEKKLVKYKPYKGVQMTGEGERIALRIIRKHRLWEVFLVKKLNITWDRVHETAEQLEHVDSPELIDKLDEFLGFPKFDPHGDPIPSKEGEFADRKTLALADINSGEQVRLAGVTMHSPDFLRYLDRIGLNIGVVIKVSEKIPFDESMGLKIGKREIIINGETSRNILVMRDQ